MPGAINTSIGKQEPLIVGGFFFGLISSINVAIVKIGRFIFMIGLHSNIVVVFTVFLKKDVSVGVGSEVLAFGFFIITLLIRNRGFNA